MRTHRYPTLTAWFGAGVKDHRKLPVSRRLAAEAVQAGLRVHEFTGPGGHNWQFASAGFAQVLPGLCESLGLHDDQPNTELAAVSQPRVP
jgi:hypothetical protein